jgi:hypothetical protein
MNKEYESPFQMKLEERSWNKEYRKLFYGRHSTTSSTKFKYLKTKIFNLR